MFFLPSFTVTGSLCSISREHETFNHSYCRLPTSHQHVTLTDFDVFGIELADLPLKTLQPPLDPTGSSEHHPCLHLDAQEDVAGMARKVGKLVNNVGQCMTANFIQWRKQNRFSQFASPVFFTRSPAIPRRQPTNTPRLDGSLMKRHIYLYHTNNSQKHCPRKKLQL